METPHPRGRLIFRRAEGEEGRGGEGFGGHALDNSQTLWERMDRVYAPGMDRRLFWLAAFLLLLAGCGRNTALPGHTVLLRDLSELRARFNADTGKVRAIFLAAPT
jgi:hypothetical protein